jgi:hypothetical protein
MKEMDDCNRTFYSMQGVASRFWSSFWQWRMPLINLITNLSTRNNSRVETQSYVGFQQYLASRDDRRPPRPAEVAQDSAPAA